MDDTGGRDVQAGGMKGDSGRGGAANVVRLEFVGALFARDEKLAQVAVSAALAKEIGDEFGGGGHEVIGRGAVDGQRAVAILEPRRFDERGEIGGVVDVEVGKENDVELGHARATFAETQGTATTGIDKNTRTTILPDEIAAGGALVLQLRPAGTEDLNSDTVLATGLSSGNREKRQCGDGEKETDKTEERKPVHCRTSHRPASRAQNQRGVLARGGRIRSGEQGMGPAGGHARMPRFVLTEGTFEK